MSFITNPDIIFKKMRDNSISLYQVFDSDNKTQIDENQDGAGVDESIDSLRSTLENLHGLVYVVIREDNTPKKRKATSDVSEENKSALKRLQANSYRWSIKLGSNTNNGGNESQMSGMGQVAMFKMVLDSMQAKHDSEIKYTALLTEQQRKFDERISELEKKSGKKNDMDLPPQMMKLIEALTTKLAK